MNGELAETIARRVAELVAARPPARLLTVEQVAEMLQVRSEWVYQHADELGALRLGDGSKGRLRFDAELVRERLRPPTTRRRASAAATGTARSRAAAAAAAPSDGTSLLRVGPKRG
ncbi:hypothetical protein [Conexibacter woesei]|uniref:Helix-turn-helix domain-containing protein n=1 Tax=Conexibacter woesei (strain DSM 14684 / CCUG 47730 / CIP 108061 / JCM 11494 / NBRC 100937 / ID131577) TaxID=469383 RepID=D3F210_CONWI|nr:hypothetical protein [Conexibacter woesei]ADB50185.1 hypothetical protein Cwoe_1758 [Conexibacter woesei DSM 14684]